MPEEPQRVSFDVEPALRLAERASVTETTTRKLEEIKDTSRQDIS